MADKTSIEWTDATWNPITGCLVKSPGCRFCYAMKLAGTRMKNHPSRIGLTVESKNGPVWTGEARLNDMWLDQPLRWSKPRMIFVCAHADLFYEAVPDEWIDRIFAVMALAPQHTFQLLTKRPERMAAYVEAFNAGERHVLGWANDFSGKNLVLDDILPETDDQEVAPLRNVWLGTSVEDQCRADERRGPLRKLAESGWLTWASYEPALGPVDWEGWEFIRWLVTGGESGNRARWSRADWHRTARDFCAGHGIAFNFKQWGCWIEADQIAARIADATEAGTAWITRDGDVWNPSLPLNFADAAWLADFLGHSFEHQSDGSTLFQMKKADAGRLLDGRLHDEFPA